jgi:hypothetical protein
VQWLGHVGGYPRWVRRVLPGSENRFVATGKIRQLLDRVFAQSVRYNTLGGILYSVLDRVQSEGCF